MADKEKEMRRLEKLRGREGVVLDTMLFVYFFEDVSELADACETLFKGMANGLFEGVATPITMAELLVKPLKEKRPDIATRYRNALAGMPNLGLSEIDHTVGCMAGALRAKYNLPLPDMLQVATATQSARPTLITNDLALKKVEDAEVFLIEDLF
jgi:predicted nucleic acid-binding protein